MTVGAHRIPREDIEGGIDQVRSCHVLLLPHMKGLMGLYTHLWLTSAYFVFVHVMLLQQKYDGVVGGADQWLRFRADGQVRKCLLLVFMAAQEVAYYSRMQDDEVAFSDGSSIDGEEDEKDTGYDSRLMGSLEGE